MVAFDLGCQSPDVPGDRVGVEQDRRGHVSS
jgi:hypothetical protein